MTTQDFIAACLMVPTKVIDDLCDEYNVDFGEEEIINMLNLCAGDVFHKHSYRNFGRLLVKHVLNEIAELYTDVLDEAKFDLDYDGCEAVISYDDVLIESKEQLDKIYNKELERQLAED